MKNGRFLNRHRLPLVFQKVWEAMGAESEVEGAFLQRVTATKRATLGVAVTVRSGGSTLAIGRLGAVLARVMPSN